ncbi:nitrate- and nitrite sensing domain-containing protein [Actinophytocola oryzae]|uniref:histidine kinase n=1 Tax=Actinophytocola oryzae TaxID=502181 RepID=A0A4R7UZ57_9PSEU|nr:nitrate- and nitrite sensing domain-containing protein [Actinophytocola oryzae]TDV42218.1 signal transduction histidine kinase [Actinophytocola oryzae]
MSSVGKTGADPVGGRENWWSATVQWRNWPLLVKLGAVLLVPVVSALALGVLRVQSDVSLAESYTETAQTAELRAQFVSVVAAVQHERAEAVRAGGRLREAAAVTDRAVAAMAEVVRRHPELGSATSGYRALERAIGSLPAARRQIGGDGMVVLSAYNAVVDTVLEFDRSLVGQFPDENLADTSIALAELQGMSEQVALQRAIGNLGLRDRALSGNGRQVLVETGVRLADKLEDFRSQAPSALTARYVRAATDEDVTTFRQLVDAIRTTDPAALPITQAQWDTAAKQTSALMTDLTARAAADLRSASAALAESVSDRAGLESVLLLTMVLLAAGIGGGLGRYLLRSVALLRRTALDVANSRLPAAVMSIRAGEGMPAIDPVPLRSTEEFGQLARAFDAVHGQAVRSAGEEASLRGNLANIFTNLSRRSQGLVERQLRLMEQLEQKTDDPDQLENLFKIDHLATRMRRNNENLMVLSGTGLLRRFAEPMALPDVLRAAISEVEHYQRAVVRSVPDVRVAGYAAGDLIRSISELIENATAFSPPDAQVTVVSRLLADGAAVVDILDVGVGMSDKDLVDANQRIAGGGGVDVPISRQMGLFVVGRLTARHGIHVRLIPRAEGGLCASVLVPAGLVNIGDPGATAAIELPVPGRGPSTATEWLGASSVATSRPMTVTPLVPLARTEGPAGHAWQSTPAELDEPVVIEVPVVGIAEAPGKQSAGPLPPAESSWPAEEFVPVEVAGMLETAGIIVSPLPDLPNASTPASILFADSTSKGAGGGEFSWLRDRAVARATAAPPPPAAPAPVTPAVTTGPAGLPKRVPKGQQPGARKDQNPPQATARNAVRARGFMTGLQAGIRQSQNREGETGS